jgi:hypothetical protein
MIFCVTSLSAQTPVDTTKSESPWGGGIEANYLHSYTWRGNIFGSYHVSQPNLWLDYKNFELIVSGNFNLVNSTTDYTGYSKNSNWDEIDFELDYTKEFDNGYTIIGKGMAYLYQFQSDTISPSTGEVAIRAEKVLKNEDWTIYTEHTADWWQYHGSLWSELGTVYTHQFKKNWSIENETALCYGSKVFNDTYFYTPTRALNFISNRLELTKDFDVVYTKLYGEINLFTNKNIATSYGKPFSFNLMFTVGKEF